MNKKLENFFRENSRIALAFSGGTDSSYLLKAALRCKADIMPFFAKSQFQPMFELEDAKKIASELEIKLNIINLDVLSADEIRSNGTDRCFHCKKMILENISGQAKASGYDILIDGTNASDQEKERPGMRALRQLNVRSPLREVGLTKDEIRRLSKEEGLFTWNKPAYACLATRVYTGNALSEELLSDIEKCETQLKDIGFYDFRVRIKDGAAKLQVNTEQMDLLESSRDRVIDIIGKYFRGVSFETRLPKPH